jgi:hypothetical protein
MRMDVLCCIISSTVVSLLGLLTSWVFKSVLYLYVLQLYFMWFLLGSAFGQCGSCDHSLALHKIPFSLALVMASCESPLQVLVFSAQKCLRIPGTATLISGHVLEVFSCFFPKYYYGVFQNEGDPCSADVNS